MELTPAPRKGNRPVKRNKLLPPRRKGVPNHWHPELVGKISGYPRTQEAFEARQRQCREQVIRLNAAGVTHRHGVPDGWAGKKKLINQINAASAAEAERVVSEMEALGNFVPDNVESKTILREALKVILAEKFTPEGDEKTVPLYAVKDRLFAMKMAWDVVQKKPLARSEVGMTRAEDFLAMLAKPPAE